MEQTEVGFPQRINDPSHLPAFFNLGQQRVAALDASADIASSRGGCQTIREKVC